MKFPLNISKMEKTKTNSHQGISFCNTRTRTIEAFLKDCVWWGNQNIIHLSMLTHILQVFEIMPLNSEKRWF